MDYNPVANHFPISLNNSRTPTCFPKNPQAPSSTCAQVSITRIGGVVCSIHLAVDDHLIWWSITQRGSICGLLFENKHTYTHKSHTYTQNDDKKYVDHIINDSHEHIDSSIKSEGYLYANINNQVDPLSISHATMIVLFLRVGSLHVLHTWTNSQSN